MCVACTRMANTCPKLLVKEEWPVNFHEFPVAAAIELKNAITDSCKKGSVSLMSPSCPFHCDGVFAPQPILNV